MCLGVGWGGGHYTVLGNASDGMKRKFSTNQKHYPEFLFCYKACIALCASVAGSEATLNKFSRLKANLVLVLIFQLVT